MKIKGITDECFSDYKKPSMFIAFPTCTFKCDEENGCALCQNSALANEPDIDIDKEEIIERYLANPITKAIVCGGLEPFDSPLDLLPFIDCFRRDYKCDDPLIIYTGYTEEELMQKDYWSLLKRYKVIIKFGRFRPNEESHYDNILGIDLISPNQYAKEIK